MPKTLFVELCDICNLELQEGEDFPHFAKRAADKLNKLSDTKWKELSVPLQTWTNKTLEALDDIAAEKEGAELPVLKGFPEPEEANVEDDAGSADEAADETTAEPEAETAEDGVDESAEEGQEAATEEDAPARVRPKKAPKATAKKAASKPGKEKDVKAPKKTATTARAASGGRGLNPNSRIKVTVKGNPYREGTGRHKRWEKLKDGMTVAQALKAGFEPVNLRYCVADGHIKITAPAKADAA